MLLAQSPCLAYLAGSTHSSFIHRHQIPIQGSSSSNITNSLDGLFLFAPLISKRQFVTFGRQMIFAIECAPDSLNPAFCLGPFRPDTEHEEVVDAVVDAARKSI